jgi:hypothetical protein
VAGEGKGIGREDRSARIGQRIPKIEVIKNIKREEKELSGQNYDTRGRN